jgi:hypothetical protein
MSLSSGYAQAKYGRRDGPRQGKKGLTKVPDSVFNLDKSIDRMDKVFRRFTMPFMVDHVARDRALRQWVLPVQWAFRTGPVA